MSTGAVMKYSVLIATYNRSDELADTLASLAAITCRDSWEVIVVDNNSTDRTPQVVADAATVRAAAGEGGGPEHRDGAGARRHLRVHRR
jgi:GT2 family glycosyltransferase